MRQSNDADPDFDELFDDTSVKRLDIVISSTRWASMLADMKSLYGTFGTRSGGSFSDENPIFVPAEVFDTDTFLKYLATNTMIQTWDTYGRMTHN